MSNPLKALSNEQQNYWVDRISSCAIGESECKAETGATVEEIKDFMLDNEHELCPACCWYMPSDTFLNEDSEPEKTCDECRE